MFSKATYIDRRKKLKTEVGEGIILLLGNSESAINYAGNIYPFRQDSSFLYFTGINRHNLALVIDCYSGDEILFGNDYSIDDIVWMGQQPILAEIGNQSGISKHIPFDKLEYYLKQNQKQGQIVHFLPAYRHNNKIRLFEWLNINPAETTLKASQKLIKAIVDQRIYKSNEEIAEIEKAVNTSVDMHVAAMRMTRSGMLEAEIAAEMNRIAEKSGGRTAFPIIATINGQTLHNYDRSNTIQDGQLFLTDAGAETTMGYAGDLSSTFPVSKKFTSKQKDIYNICLAAHETAIAMLKPGIEFKEVYYGTARKIFDGLKTVGLTKGNTDDALFNGAHAMFFPCGLGHMMGLDVHDLEDLGENIVGWNNAARSKQFGVKSLRLGRKLEPGFVLTIEPGIYFIPELIDLWKKNKINIEYLNFDILDQYRQFGGVRNEEDFLITTDTKKLLGKPKPKTIEEVESEREYAF